MSQTERLFYIDRSIRNTGCVTLDDIMKKFEVSRRQVKRDIEYLRDRLDAPIVWNRYKRRYEYASPWNRLQFADEKQLLALAFIEAILRRLYYVPFFSEQLVQTLKHQLGSRYISIADKVRYELPYFEEIDIEVASALSHSLMESLEVSILYRDASGRESQRNIVALRMVNYGGKWYCVAFDSLSEELRVFAVSRMTQPRLGAKTVRELPSRDEIEHYLSASYGIFKGEPIGTAVLRFHG
ncbi:MAG: WYL domain-containing protein, partial [Rectinemataceae bacterium]